MKISICIPQYGRASLLEKSLRIIEAQTYPDIEIVVSDDCSTDDTVERISSLQKNYKYPVILSINEKNMGYDRNYRKSIELATGDYCLVIGNDDTLHGNDAIAYLVEFLEDNERPEIGFCNYVEENNPGSIVERAISTQVVGQGPEIAVKFCNGFSFVGGLIYKKSTFDQYNTNKHDGSIFSQMYLGALMIASGCRLFTIHKPLVMKDIHFEDGSFRWSYYRDGLPKSWKEYRIMDGGLPSVANVLTNAIEDATENRLPILYFKIFSKMYSTTFPFWVVQYKKYGSYAAAFGLIQGMKPSKIPSVKKLSYFGKLRIQFIYLSRAFLAFLFPVKIFDIIQNKLYRFVKSRNQ